MTERQIEKLDLLSKPSWNCEDIINYFESVKTKPTAFRLKERAIKEYDGGIPYSSSYAKTDSILALFGTSREKEIRIIKSDETEKEL